MSLRKTLREAAFIAVVVVGTLAARSSLADHYRVPTGSIIPTVQPGDRVVVSKLAYGLRLPFSDVTLLPAAGPSPGDVVVLRSPKDDRVLLKRVVAVPGQRVAVRDGGVIVDGHPQREPYRNLAAGGGPDYGPLTLPPGKYLVVGDNRGDSHDGRSFGVVDRAAFLGRARGVVMRQGRFVWQPL